MFYEANNNYSVLSPARLAVVIAFMFLFRFKNYICCSLFSLEIPEGEYKNTLPPTETQAKLGFSPSR